jgi:S1-C subfamily serine protease
VEQSIRIRGIMGRIAAIWRLAALGCLLAIPGGFAPSAVEARDAAPRPLTPRGELGADEKATIALFEHSRDSVVFITTREKVRDFWSRDVLSVPRGTGSGFLWDEAGDVVTNYHVVEGASEATVKLADGRSYRASLVGASANHDIAVLRVHIDARRPAPLPLGSSHDLRVGQKVFAIGNPFGLDWSLTSGIVSALNRSLDEDQGRTIEHLIQTDAAINPGNSGGPLLDSAGRLIGMNTAIYSPNGANAGIGFAVPVDTINRIVPQIIRYGGYRQPTLGIETDEDINRRLLAMFDTHGVAVLQVAPGQAADRAGLRSIVVTADGTVVSCDFIVAIDGKPVGSVRELETRLDDYDVGDRVRITVQRQGKKLEVSATLRAEE